MRILLVGEFSRGALGASYSRAFTAMGYAVSEFDFVAELDALGVLARNCFTKRVLEDYFKRVLNRKLLTQAKIVRPDFVMVIKGPFVFPETIRTIQRHGDVLVFNLNPDNPFNHCRGASNDTIRNAIGSYDGYLTWGKFLIPELIKAGAKHVEYLPFACDPHLHYPVEVSKSEWRLYQSDLVFIGTWDKERERWLEPLADYDLGIWGQRWNRAAWNSPLKAKWKGRVVLGEDFSKVCRASKIVINLLRAQNGDAHNMRTFEVPACQGLMLTTRSKEQCEFFEEGYEIACFETPNELRAMIDHYLHEERLRIEMGHRAYRKVQPQTYFERAKEIVKVYNKLRCPGRIGESS